jgi:hypothetical protein
MSSKGKQNTSSKSKILSQTHQNTKNRGVMAMQAQTSIKMPKKHSYDVDGIEKRIQKSSPWYQSIMNPLQGAGAKIPDAVGIPTGTFQMTQTVSVPVNAQGISALRICSPYPNGGTVPASGMNWMVNAATSSVVDLWTTGVKSPFSGYSGLTPSLITGARVVSAALFAEYEGTTLNDSGDFTCWQSPFGASADNTALTTYQSKYAVSIVPINRSRDKPVVSRWYPIEIGTTIVNTATGGGQLIPITRDYRAFCTLTGTVDSAAANAASPPNWEMGIVASGLPASVGSVRFKMVVNLEILPATNASQFFGAQNSPIDRAEEDKVLEWVQDTPLTGLAPVSFVDVPASSAAVDKANRQQSESPISDAFGMAGTILKEALPLLALL